MKIERLDHLNLTVADIARSCEFYTRVLGMEAVTFGEGRAALRFGQQKINLDCGDSVAGRAGEKRMPAHLCFVTDTPLAEVMAHLERCAVPIAMGPGPRSGATGTIQSVYISDPDHNSIEISNY
jgi:catechol 2,3-dioxygenase-like lactoylglutathione lyase family enzyme